MKKFTLSILALTLTLSYVTQAKDLKPSDIAFRGVAETGFLYVIAHEIQFSNNGTNFDYVADGGQDVLFPVTRYSVELDVGKKNTFILLYQPLQIASKSLLRNDLVVDNQTFPALSTVNFRYDFPFYRASYLRELMTSSNPLKLAAGASLQIRNATISFESSDGERFRTNSDIGLVPALKLRGHYTFAKRFFAGFEADGIYAPVSYLNGSDNEIVGAILDASLRVGAQIRMPGAVFVNMRYIGGGATGTGTKDIWPGDGYVKNWLHFFIASVGGSYQF